MIDSWYTIVLKDSSYDQSLVECFREINISVVRVYPRQKDLVVEIFIAMPSAGLESRIKHEIISLPEYQLLQQKGISFYEGVENSVIPETVYYTGVHFEDELFRNYVLTSNIKGYDPNDFNVSFLFLIIICAFALVIGLTAAVYGAWNVDIFLFIFGIIIIYMVWKSVKSFAYHVQVKEKTLAFSTLVTTREIPLEDVIQLEIRLTFSYWATIDFRDGRFRFPIMGAFTPRNEREFISAFLARTGFGLISGRNRASCVFKAVRPYIGE